MRSAPPNSPVVDLSSYKREGYRPKRSPLVIYLWYLLNLIVIRNPFNPSSRLRAITLRLFGAIIGHHVILRPGLRVKYPWELEVGNYTWIGEDVWIDNYAKVRIGNHACLSQGTYLCTGNHDWNDPAFAICPSPITIEDGVWIGARCLIAPNVTLGAQSVVSAGATVFHNLDAFGIYSGNPAVKVHRRRLSTTSKRHKTAGVSKQ